MGTQSSDSSLQDRADWGLGTSKLDLPFLVDDETRQMTGHRFVIVRGLFVWLFFWLFQLHANKE